MLTELIDMFLGAAPLCLDQIAASVHDGPKLAFHAGALKGMSLNLGARRVIELAGRLEELAKTGNFGAAPALLQELEAAFAQTKTQLMVVRQTA